MDLPVPTDHRDRLLAALLAEDPTMVLLRWDPSIAVLLATKELRHVVVLTVPDDTPRDRLREAFTLQVKAVEQGSPPTHFVAVGGGPEVAAALAEAAPLVEPVRLGFHHVDASGRAGLVKGSPLPVLDRAAARVDASAPPDPQPLADALARGQRLVQQERAAAAKLSGRYRVTVAIVVACVALAALGWAWSDGAYDLALWRMGANRGAAVKGGEVYRLFASAFLHANALHLGVNMLALWSFGPMLEAILGPRRYVLLYAASALGGSLASAFLGGDRWSVGASGAIWGLMAAGIGLALRPKGVLPPLMASNLRSRAWGPLVINVIYSLQPGVDMLAHLGGGVVGFALMATVLTEGLVPIDERATANEAERGARWGVTGAAVIAAAAMALSVGAALIQGKPWTLGGPVAMERVAVPSTGITVELPAAVASKKTEGVPEDGKTVAFGDLREVPVIFEIVVADRAEPVPPEALDAVLDSARKNLDEQVPASFKRKGSAQRTKLGARPVVVAQYELSKEVGVKTYFLLEGTREVLISAYARAKRPESWAGIEERVAVSVRGP